MAGKPDRENQRRSGQSRSIKTRQTAQLSDPEGAGGELSGDVSLPSAFCIADRVLAILYKPVLILAEENIYIYIFVPWYFTVLYPADLEVILNLNFELSPPHQVQSPTRGCV